jgi:gamma-glutamyltranspeptidase/glutathione hydrolase
MAAYQAREVKPLQLKWKNCVVYTAPLTAGGLTVLEALSILKALDWDGLPPSPAAAHAWLEALRVSWHDRLGLLGDPEKVKVPVTKLLSTPYAREVAARIQTAVNARRPLDLKTGNFSEEGTVTISSVDRRGNMVALTLTHGGTFGAQVTVDGLGLTLGHGMSRFQPQPGHPNSPGPGKRPLNNMSPSVVLRDGKPVLAVGGRGGVRVPNGVLRVLTHYLLRGASMEEAVAAPRLQSTGTLEVTVERSWPKAEADYLKQIGYVVGTGPNAHISAVSFNPKTGECRGVMR